MSNQRSTYQSIRQEESPLMVNPVISIVNEPQQQNDRPNRRFRQLAFTVLGLAMMTFVIAHANVGGYHNDGGYDYHTPRYALWGASVQRMKAQNQADDSRKALLAPMEGSVELYKLRSSKKHPPTSSKVQDGCEGTVMIIRHCEKFKIREHCSYLGYERSVYLRSLFGHDDERWPAPSYIYAENPGGRENPKKKNFREIETVLPVAEKAEVVVDGSFDSTGKLAAHLTSMFREGEMCGKLAIVSWKHSEIGHLANKLGCGPSQGCPLDYHGSTFDEVWQIKFAFRKAIHSERKNGKIPKNDRWEVYGSIQHQNFDPLAVSKVAGDYPKGGVAHGAKWNVKAPVDYPDNPDYNKKVEGKKDWLAEELELGKKQKKHETSH